MLHDSYLSRYQSMPHTCASLITFEIRYTERKTDGMKLCTMAMNSSETNIEIKNIFSIINRQWLVPFYMRLMNSLTFNWTVEY